MTKPTRKPGAEGRRPGPRAAEAEAPGRAGRRGPRRSGDGGAPRGDPPHGEPAGRRERAADVLHARLGTREDDEPGVPGARSWSSRAAAPERGGARLSARGEEVLALYREMEAEAQRAVATSLAAPEAPPLLTSDGPTAPPRRTSNRSILQKISEPGPRAVEARTGGGRGPGLPFPASFSGLKQPPRCEFRHSSARWRDEKPRGPAPPRRHPSRRLLEAFRGGDALRRPSSRRRTRRRSWPASTDLPSPRAS